MSNRPEFKHLSENLLRSGVAPARVRRVSNELADHFHKLVEEEVERGTNEQTARTLAYSALGSQAALIAEYSSHPEFRSWAARWPALVYATAPIVAFVAVIVAVAAATVLGVRLIVDFSGGSLMLEAGVQAFLKSCAIVAPITLAFGISMIAIRRRSSWLWPASGIAAIALFGGSFNVFVGWENDVIAWVTVNSTFIWPFPDRVFETLVRATITMVIILAPYIYLSRTLAIPCRESPPLPPWDTCND